MKKLFLLLQKPTKPWSNREFLGQETELKIHPKAFSIFMVQPKITHRIPKFSQKIVKRLFTRIHRFSRNPTQSTSSCKEPLLRLIESKSILARLPLTKKKKRYDFSTKIHRIKAHSNTQQYQINFLAVSQIASSVYLQK